MVSWVFMRVFTNMVSWVFMNDGQSFLLFLFVELKL